MIWSTLICIDQPSDITLSGDSYLSWDVIKCTGTSTVNQCKNSSEIDAFIDELELVLVYNTQTYTQANYGENTVSNHVKLESFPLHSFLPQMMRINVI